MATATVHQQNKTNPICPRSQLTDKISFFGTFFVVVFGLFIDFVCFLFVFVVVGFLFAFLLLLLLLQLHSNMSSVLLQRICFVVADALSH